jgi:ribosomal protein L11 methyltransferase
MEVCAMKYIQVDIEVRAEEIEAVVGLLLVEGITDTVIEDPADLDRLLNKEVDYEWDYIAPEVLERQHAKPKVTFYTEDNAERHAQIKSIIEAISKAFPEAIVNVKVDDDSEWKDKWKEYFKPTKVGKRIVVKPTWESYDKKEDELVINIDPDMAFGTGTHETTSLCLKLMEDYVKAGDKVLDVGCGSGILSLGGALLGAGETLAIDIDPEAVKIAAKNVALNHCDDKVKVKVGNLVDGVDFKANVIVANLMADLVIMLSKYAKNNLLPKGIFISSGILVEKRDLVAQAMKDCSFEIKEIREDGMWCAIAAVEANNE